MKIAIIGRGKTGSKVKEQTSPEDIVGVYGKEDFPSLQELQQADVAIVFIPGDAFLQIIPALLEAKIPVVSGATGFNVPANLDQELRNREIPWVFGSNFSIGMNIFFLINERLNALSPALGGFNLSMTEKHHTKKLDTPSGSALSIRNYYDVDLPIDSVREGDTVGYHEVLCESSGEKIQLSHKALDRSIFAKGAIWAAQLISAINLNSSIKPGLHNFTDVLAHQSFGER